jgi:hypothetical protein
MSNIYDDDVLLWSERQASLLRRVAAGGRINAADLDWPNIIEEIESVGQSQVDQVELWLFQMSLHLLKGEAWPLSGAVPHWQGEARTFRVQARRIYRASVAQKLDVPGLYADAVQALPDTIDGTPPLPLPDVCPWTLDELLSEG